MTDSGRPGAGFRSAKPLRRSLPALVLVLAGCARSPQSKYEDFLNKGEQFLASGDYRRAVLNLSNAIQVQPRQAEAYYQLGLAYLKLNQPAEAGGAMRAATDLNPKHTGAQVRFSQLLLDINDQKALQSAESRAAAVLAAEPRNDDAFYVLAAAEARLGKAKEAEAALHKILERSPQHLRSALALSRILFLRKDTGGAEAVLKRALERAPRSADASVALGSFYALTAKPSEAEALFHRALEIDPKNTTALLQLGQSQIKRGAKDEAGRTYKRIAAFPQKELQSAYGLFLIQQDRAGDAIQEFARLSKTDPDDRIERIHLVDAYVRANRVAEAERVLNETLKRHPKDADALLQRSQLEIRRGKLTEAQSDLNSVIQFEPTSAQAHYLLAEVLKMRGLALQQKRELGEALRLAPALLPARIEMARVLVASKHTESALNLLNEAPEIQRHSLEWIAAGNWTLMAHGDRAQARKAVSEALATARTRELVLQDGFLKLTSNDGMGAKADFEEVLKSTPDELLALRGLAEVYAAQKRPVDGMEALRNYVMQQRTSFRVQMFWANWLAENGRDGPEVRQAIANAKAADPRQSDPDLLLARLDLKEGRIDDARRTLTGILGADQWNVPAQLLLGMADDLTKNCTQAVKHYRKVIEIDGSNLEALNNLAFDLSRGAGPLDEALKYAERAKEIAPDSSVVQDTLGWIYYRKGLYGNATSELKSALAKQARPCVKFHLGMTYMRIGNSGEGNRLISAALQEDPTLLQTESVSNRN